MSTSRSHVFGLSLVFRHGRHGRRGLVAALLFLASALPSFAQSMTLTGTVSPTQVSYIGTLTYSASASGGDPATRQYAFFRRRPGGTWIPSINSPNWQSSSTFNWRPSQSDVGTWETYIWVKDGTTPPTQYTYGYAAGYNTMPIEVFGPPTVPGPTSVSCAYAPSGECWVTGDFVASVSASSGGLGSISYQICRSTDTTGWGGCDVNLTLSGGTSTTVSGSHLPADGYQRAYYFQARDSAGANSGWNSPRFVRVDRYAPSVGATNASDVTWYSYRTATVSASDSGSGVQSVRYSWNSTHNSSCTSGTGTSSGSTLIAPAGDNVLYLCAKDNTGRVGQWSGRYRVSPLGLTGSVSPSQGSYLGSFTYTASASGGTPSTTRYAFFRRRPGGAWIPDVNAPSWQSSNVYSWTPTSADTGVWETYMWVKDGDTPSSMSNGYGYAAGFNTGPITVNGAPTVPGPTTAACAYTASGECWVQGDFTASVTASTGGSGSLVYQICRSNDTTGSGGCDVNLTLSGGTSILVSGTHLPSDGYRRAYYFQGRDSAGANSGWNTPLYVRVDRYAPTVSATDSSATEWYYSRTATVSASDAHSGVQSVRYSWNAALDAACTTGTATSSGAALAAPVGDNTLYLCAKDNTGRVGQWNGRYRIAAGLGLTGCSVSPSQASYTGSFTYTATATGGIPSTTRFAFFRRRPNGVWIPDVANPTWLAANQYTWSPTQADAGTWETYIWVKDGNTPPTQNGHGYAAGCNSGPITVVGPPTVPGPTTVSCAYTSADNCWVQGDFTASATASTGGVGTVVYQICRSNDTAASGGCEVNLTLTGGTSIAVTGTHLPSDGYRRAYYFQAKDAAGGVSGWNTPRYVRVDRYAPTLSASNASDTTWFSSRTATVAASDSGSGLAAVRYSWGTALDAGCTTGLATSSGAALAAPAGDNLLYLCARDNTGRVAQWNGRYRVSPLGLTGTVTPKPASYLDPVTYTATATGGTPATTVYAFFRRRPGSLTWTPDVANPNWQAGNVFTWQPTQADTGTWETYIWVKDGDTPAGANNNNGFAAGFNTGPIDIVGAPTVPGPTTVSCAHTATDNCWVQGDFTASVTASTGGKGSLVYQICRSNDTTGLGGCDVNLTLTGGTSITVSGTHLPADGYRRAYYFQAKDSSGAPSGWNTPRYVRVDRQAPELSATNASESWFRSRTATVSASDIASGLQTVRYSWNTALDSGCTTGTSTANGATLTPPSGDNMLYLCAKDNVARVTQWSGRYRVAAPLSVTVTRSPAKSSYLSTLSWTATASGGVPGTVEYRFGRHRAGTTDPWIATDWQSSGVFTWTPALADVGLWDTYVVVRDSLTAPDANGAGYDAGANPWPVEIVGKPTVPGPTTVSCAHSASEDCWVTGDFTATVTASTGGMGSLVYQICRSNDSAGGFSGCDVNLTLTGGTSIAVSGANLPGDGFRRSYWFQAKDSAGALSGWNTQRYVRVDRYNPTVGADNASDVWFSSRTATVSAADATNGAGANSGLAAVRYNWNTALDAACTGGTATAPGATLTVPVGDNLLYLCAKDNTGRVVQWNGRYRVTEGLTLTGTITPNRTSHGNTFTWTATASGGDAGSRAFAFFRRRPGGEWIPAVTAPNWQSGNTYTWTPGENDLGTWETYIWVKDANTSPTEKTYGYTAGFNTGPVEVLEALTLTATRSPLQSRAGDTLSWTAFAEGGDEDTRQFALFRRRPNGTWIPAVTAPDWQPSNVLTWTPTTADLGVWETYIWVKDATTPPTQNIHGYGAGYNTGPVEIVQPEDPDFALELTPAATTTVRGGSATYTLSITGNATFEGTATLSISGLPTAASHTLDSSVIGVGDTATLTVTTTASTPAGSYDITITAVSGGLTRTSKAGLTVRLPAASGEPVIDSITPDQFDGGGIQFVTIRGRNFQDATVTVATEDPDPDNPSSRVFPDIGWTVSPDGTRIDVEVDSSEPAVMDFYALVVDNGVGKAASKPFRVIPAGPVVDLVTPSRPERGEDDVYVLTLGGYNLDNATVHTEPAGALVVFGLDATETNINGLLRVPDDAPLGPVDLVVTGSTGLQARITIEIVAPGAAMVATQRIGTRRVDPVTLRSIAGPSPTVLFQRFAVRDLEKTEVTEKGMKVRTANSMKKLNADDFSFSLYYRYTVNLFNFSWTRAFVFDPLTQQIGDEVLKNLGLGDKVRIGAFILSFSLRVDLTIDLYLTNTGFTWPRFCIQITTRIQIPGTEGFYEQWSFCGGGRWFSFIGGGTDAMSVRGGPCAEVTPEGPEGPTVDGMFYAEVEQTACCSQPIEVSGVGYTFTGPFNITTPAAGATTPGPSCTCSVSAPPACLIKDKEHTFTAQGAPAGGTYQWRVVQGSSRVSILSGATSSNLRLKGTATSGAADDVELEVAYTSGTNTCTQRMNLSVVEIETQPVEFLGSGTLDANNNKRLLLPERGMPQLGAVRPGTPAGNTGFTKNIQVKARIKPCDANLRCRFDFKREKQGISAQIGTNGVPVFRGGNCPQGGCNDDAGDSEEDLVVDPAPGCSIFGLDTPGVGVGTTTGACPNHNGATLISCFNFDEWLEVDGVRATTNKQWHASTRVKCNGTDFQYDTRGAGNVVGEGHIDCSEQRAVALPSTAPISKETGAAAAPSLQTAMESVSRLDDPSIKMRADAYNALLRRARTGTLQAERAMVVAALVERARDEAQDGELMSAPLLAIELMGELRAAEAVPVLLERLLAEFVRPLDSDADFATPAAQALAKIGEPAIAPLLDLAASANEDEWRQVQMSLELMRRPGLLRETVTARLAEDRGAREQERLRELLDMLK